MENIKYKIDAILSEYKIEKEYLKKCLMDIYGAGSRMPYYIVDKKNKKIGNDKSDALWTNFGIPHQIFLNLDKYIFDKEEGETDPAQKVSA